MTRRRDWATILAVTWEPPKEIEEYRIVRPLGAGTMGIVFLAHDTRLDRPAAIKLTPRFAGKPLRRSEAPVLV